MKKLTSIVSSCDTGASFSCCLKDINRENEYADAQTSNHDNSCPQCSIASSFDERCATGKKLSRRKGEQEGRLSDIMDKINDHQSNCPKRSGMDCKNFK